MNGKKVLNNLKKYINMEQIKSVITQCSINKDVKLTLLNCLKNENNAEINILKIESVIDYLYEELNTGHWSNVPVELKQCYSCANFIKLLIILSINDNDLNDDLIKNCLKSLDMALLLGAPIGNNKFVTFSAKYLSNLLLNENNELKKLRQTKRKEMDFSDENIEIISDGIEIEMEICPSLERFRELYFQLQLPVKLKECMGHWPAMKKWQDVNYFIKMASNRTVPVEIGKRYTDKDWSQKLMLLKDFIINYYLSEDGDGIGYLAQHNLFEQIIELKEDIRIPEYCCISLNYEKEPDINAWFGPKGTISPLHYDPQNNILAQVYGTKQLILFSPNDTPYLYPHEDKMLFNTSQVDVLKPNLMKYPNFSKAKAFKCIIRPGDMLFIPKKWWHHVIALDKSFSVSFWWE